jgi:hypothetical protein
LIAGNHQRAVALCKEITPTVNESGDRWAEASLFCIQGWLALDKNEPQQAEKFFQRSIQAAFSTQAYIYGMEAILGLAALWVKSGVPDQAATLLGFLIYSSITPNMIKNQASKLLFTLRGLMGDEHTAEAVEHAKTLTLEEVEQLLAQNLAAS